MCGGSHRHCRSAAERDTLVHGATVSLPGASRPGWPPGASARLAVVALSLVAGLLAACGGSHGTTTVTATVVVAPPATSAPTPGAPTATVATPAPTTATAAVRASSAAPLDAAALAGVASATAGLDAASGGLGEATATCAASGDCAAAQAIAGTTRAAHTALALAVAEADRDVLRGSSCDAAIGDLLDAVHRLRGRLEDLLARFGDGNVQRFEEARARIDASAAAFASTCRRTG